MSSQPKTFLTPEEYLAIERKAEYKSEYSNGEMFALARSNRNHSLIAGNIAAQLGRQLKDSPSEVYISSMRLKIPLTAIYTYPDVSVVSEGPKFEDEHFDTLLNPTVLVEVLSPSTESYDRGKKSCNYRTIESLAEYLLVSQDEYRVEQYSKQPDGRWLLTDARPLEGIVDLASIQCVLKLKDVYGKVALP